MTLAVCLALVALVRGPTRRTVMVSEWDVLSDNSPVIPKSRARHARTQVGHMFAYFSLKKCGILVRYITASGKQR
jgi:hypothetical protein